jgi:hypothetical protein
MIEFMTRVGKIFDRNLIKQHSIFQRSQRMQQDLSDDFDLPLRSNDHKAILKSGDIEFLDLEHQEQQKKRQALSKLKNQNIKRSMRRSYR